MNKDHVRKGIGPNQNRIFCTKSAERARKERGRFGDRVADDLWRNRASSPEIQKLRLARSFARTCLQYL